MELNYWLWFVVAVVLVVVEVLSPVAYFLWLGIAAAIVGSVVWLFPTIPVLQQLLLFAVLAMAAVALVKMYFRQHKIATDQPGLNRRGAQYVGRVFTLESPIVNGIGKLRVDDTTWKIQGADLPAGSHVTVVGVDNTILRVERSETM